jgi:hypothetical protein
MNNGSSSTSFCSIFCIKLSTQFVPILTPEMTFMVSKHVEANNLTNVTVNACAIFNDTAKSKQISVGWLTGE